MKKILYLIIIVLLIIFLSSTKENVYNIRLSNFSTGNINASEYLISKANATNVSFTNGNVSEMYTFEHNMKDQTNVLIDYRYIGNQPSNFVLFNCDDDNYNCEIWRIVGVFEVDDGTGNYEKRIKLVRGSLLPYKMSFDEENNNWIESDLKTFLNEDYLERKQDAQLYGLKNLARSQISETVFYLGSGSSYNVYDNTEDIYYWERSNNPYDQYDSNRKTSWTGKIGLMYPSDQYMTYANGIDILCYNNPYYCNEDYSTDDSSINIAMSWIYASNNIEGQINIENTWFLSSDSSYMTNVYNSSSEGPMYYEQCSSKLGVRPVVYLKPDIKILSGTGEKNNPYKIGFSIKDFKQDNVENINLNIDDSPNTREYSREVIEVPDTVSIISEIFIYMSITLIVLGTGIYVYSFYISKNR